MIERLRNFTYEAYVELLKILKSRYNIVTVGEAPEAIEPLLILRHDVDGSMASALRMAKIEKQLEIRATYFILFSHKLYNVFEADNFHTLKEISDLGHEIGLHYDPEAFDRYSAPPHVLLDKQIEILSLLLGVSVKTIARHKNSLREVVDPFSDTPYLSADFPQDFSLVIKDPYRVLVDEYIEKLLSFKYDRVQLSLHPFYWGNTVMDRQECLRALFDNAERDDKKYYRSWLNVWETKSQ